MPLATTIITVLSSIGATPLAGALVFINGVSVGTSDSNGQVVLGTLTAGTTYSLSAKLTGYTTNTIPLLGGASQTISLVAAAAAATVTFVLTVNPETDANGSSITFDNAGSPISVIYTPGGTQVAGLTPGTQNVTGTVGTYAPIVSSFNVGSGAGQVLQGTVNLVNNTDMGLATMSQTQQPADPNTSTILPYTSTENVPEFIAPNTGQGTYFTMTQARMYIGTMFIDELNGLQFTLQDNKI